MTYKKATSLANRLTKEFKKYYTAIPCKDGWKPSKKYHKEGVYGKDINV